MDMKEGDAVLQMKIAKLLFLLSAKERALLYEVLEGVYEHGCEDGMDFCSNKINERFNDMFYPRKHEKDLII